MVSKAFNSELSSISVRYNRVAGGTQSKIHEPYSITRTKVDPLALPNKIYSERKFDFQVLNT